MYIIYKIIQSAPQIFRKNILALKKKKEIGLKLSSNLIFFFLDIKGSWSKLGSAAESVALNKPTVVLNFDHCRNDFDIQATIVHQFGHVLGLGHMHQHPYYWNVIMKFLDLTKMLNDLDMPRKQFDTQWSNMQYVEHFNKYDENSIMHYQ